MPLMEKCLFTIYSSIVSNLEQIRFKAIYSCVFLFHQLARQRANILPPESLGLLAFIIGLGSQLLLLLLGTCYD